MFHYLWMFILLLCLVNNGVLPSLVLWTPRFLDLSRNSSLFSGPAPDCQYFLYFQLFPVSLKWLQQWSQLSSMMQTELWNDRAVRSPPRTQVQFKKHSPFLFVSAMVLLYMHWAKHWALFFNYFFLRVQICWDTPWHSWEDVTGAAELPKITSGNLWAPSVNC